MNGWWCHLNMRERWFVSSGGYVAVVFALCLFLVEPVHSDLSTARKRLEREAVITAELEAIAREARAPIRPIAVCPNQHDGRYGRGGKDYCAHHAAW